MEEAVRKKERNSWIEILRLIAMLMIFFHHAVLHGGTSFYGTLDFQDFIRECMYHGGKLGVIIYVLLSGYNLYSSKLTLKKVIKFIIEIYLFNIALFIYYQTTSQYKITSNIHKILLFPFSNNQYWFISLYLLILLGSPLFNIAINNITKSQHIITITVLFLLTSLLPSLYSFSTYTQEILIFVLFYFMGAFLKKYPLKDLKGYKFLFLGGAIIIYLYMNYLIIYFGSDLHSKKIVNRFIEFVNSSVSILIASLLVIFFTQLKPIRSKVINFLSCGTLEIYLLHDSIFTRYKVFHLVYDGAKIPYSSTWALEFFFSNLIRFLAILLICIAIKQIYTFTICKGIDLIDKRIIEYRNNKKKELEEKKDSD